MSKKVRVGILFGGKSTEHEVSLASARNIVNALPKEKYEPFLIKIDKRGQWGLVDSEVLFTRSSSKGGDPLLTPQSGMVIENWDNIDVVFPVLHGPNGEDGTVQGLLEVLGIPYVGPSLIGSAIGMDKDICKRLLGESGVPVARSLCLRKGEEIPWERIEKDLKYPVFVKPANAGSSVGVSKVKIKNDLKSAVEFSFRFDHKILIEEYVMGKEVECAVLGNREDMKASVPGTVIPTHEFYSYEAKYTDENGAKLEIPACISEEEKERIQRMAIHVCQTLDCEGMSRVDFFLTQEGEIIVNEINTIPGFTDISMYPKLWEESGISCSDLVDRLLQLAVERRKRRKEIVQTKEED
jgi:D-alanine-D-alanine ligase